MGCGSSLCEQKKPHPRSIAGGSEGQPTQSDTPGIFNLPESSAEQASVSEGASLWSGNAYTAADVDCLLRTRADVNIPDRRGRTPIFYAAAAGSKPKVTQLLEVGAVCDEVDNAGDTPLILLANREVVDEGIAFLLIEGRVDVAAINAETSNALLKAAENRHSTIVEAILNTEKAMVAHQDTHGASALMYSAFQGDSAVCKLFIDRHADINVRAKPGCTPLHLAAANNHCDTIRLLAAHKAELDIQDDQEFTPIMRAASYRNQEATGLLIELGSNVNLVTPNGNCALSEAVCINSSEIVAVLCGSKVDVAVKDKGGYSMLVRAALHSNIRLLEVLLDAKADPGMCSFTGWSVLMSAAVSGSVEVVQRILEGNIREEAAHHKLQASDSDGSREPGARTVWSPDHGDCAGHTALIWSARRGHDAVLQCLLEQKADPNVQDGRGRTALIWAACCGHLRCVEHLVQHRAVIELNDKDAKSALMWSMDNAHSDVQLYLAKAQPQIVPSLKSSDGADFQDVSLGS